MKPNLTQNTFSDIVEALVPVKKTWNQPDFILLEKEVIEGVSSPGNDGGGTSTFS